MSQVRKYDTGGSVQEKPKTQTPPARRIVPGMTPVVVQTTASGETTETPIKSYIIIDGEKIANTEEERQKLREYAARVSDPNGGSPVWNDIINKAEELANSENGGDLFYDTPSNGLYYKVRGTNGEYDPNADTSWNMESLNDKQDARLSKERSWLGKVLDANLNTKVQRAARTIGQLKDYKNYRYKPSTDGSNPSEEDKRLKIGYNPDWFDYLADEKGVFQKDENGNLKYDVNSTKNVDLQTRIQRGITALGMTSEEAAKYFNTDEFSTWASLKQLYDADPQGFLNRLNEAIDNMVAGKQPTPEDLSILKLFNIVPGAKPTPTKEELAAIADAEAREKWKTSGHEDLYDNAHEYFDIGDDNLLAMNEAGKKALEELGIFNTGGYEMNDAWIAALGNAHKDYTPFEWLNGYTMYNGKLYKTNSAEDPNSALAKIYKTSGFYDNNTRNLYQDAQKIIQTFWGNKYDWETPGEGYYSSFTYDKGNNRYRTGRRYRSANGLYNWNNRGNDQLVQYYDEDAPRDWQGYVTEDGIRYAITDSRGNIKVDGLTEKDLTDRGFTRTARTSGEQINYGDSENTAFRQTELIRSDHPVANNHYLISYGDSGQYGIYVNPMANTPTMGDPSSYVVYSDPSLGAGYVVPPILASMLLPSEQNGNRNYFETILNSPKLQEKFRNILQEFSKTRKKGSIGRTLGVGTATFNNLLKPLGFTDEQIKAACEEWFSMIEDPQRANKYIVDYSHFKNPDTSTSIMKQGGTIRKYKPGGGFGGSASVDRAKTPVVESKTKIKDSRKSAKAFSFKDLTTADKADIVGLGLDLAAIAAGAAPVAGGLVGLAGSGAGLYADVRRDGFQWRDIGNFGVSVAGDALSLIGGGAGTAGQAAKAVTKIKKLAPTLLKIAATYGAVSTIPLISKAASGDLTWAETRQLAAGLAGAINLAKSGGFGKKTQPGKYEDVNVKSKTVRNEDIFEIKGKAGTPADTPSIQLTKDQIDEVNGIRDPIARLAKWREYTYNSVKDNPIYAGKTKDQVLDNYDFDPYMRAKAETITGDKITVKGKNGAQDIELDKTAIDAINNEPDVLTRMVKMRNEIKAKIKAADPTISNKELAVKARSYDIDEYLRTTDSTKTDLATNATQQTTTPDIKLEDADLEAIKKARDPEKKFIEIVQSKTGDTSLDTRDKIKNAFDVDDFFQTKRHFSDRNITHPFGKKKETFALGDLKRKNDPYAGKYQWWHQGGRYRGFDREYYNTFTDPRAVAAATGAGTTPTPPAPTPTGGRTTRTGTNFNNMYKRLFERRPVFTAMHIGTGSPHDRALLPEISVEGDVLPGYVPDETEEYYMYKKGGRLVKTLNVGGHFFDPVKLPNFNPVDTLEFSKYLKAISSNNKAARIESEPYKHQPTIQGVTYQKPSFTDNGLTRTTQNLITDIYNRTPSVQTSDPTLNNFYKKANLEQATKYQNELNSKFSSLVDQHNQRTLEIENKQRASDIDTLNQNRKQDYIKRQNLARIESSRIGANYKSMDNLLGKTIVDLAGKKYKADAAIEKLNDAHSVAKRAIELQNNEGYKEVMSAWNSYKNANQGASFEEWINGAGAKYKAQYETAIATADRNKAINDMAGLTEQYGPYAGRVTEALNAVNAAFDTAGASSLKKKGGTINRRTWQEQIYIDNNRAYASAVKQLRNETQQLLLKMLK